MMAMKLRPTFSMLAAAGCAVTAILVGACNKPAPPAAPPPAAPVSAAAEDPAFDGQWAELAKAGLEVTYIEDDRGQGLMGNVRRASLFPQPDTAPPPSAQEILPEVPAGEDIQRVIRQNLTAVKGCYLTMSRAGQRRSGKAIITFDIGADGRPAALKVTAPTFQGTNLPTCVSNQIANWTFPKSKKGGGQVSYPFVFVGS